MSWTPPPSQGPPPTWVGPYGPPTPTPWGPPPAGLGYTGPGYEQQYGPPRPTGSDGTAIASLIFGIIGWVLLSVPFGIAALGRIRRTGQDGRGLAVAGLVLSGLWTVFFVVLAIVIAAQPTTTTSGAQRPTAGSSPTSTSTPSTGSSPVPVNSLQVGDCVNGLRDSEHLLSLPSVPCAQLHEGEVFAVFDLPPGRYPGHLSPAITAQCSSRFVAYAPTADVRNIGLYVVYPRPESWARGNREVDCIATSNSGSTTGSLRSGGGGDGGGGLST